MTVQKRKEIEIKVRIGDDFPSLEAYRPIVKRIGFIHHNSRLETDYLPDTNDDLFKRAGLLLRFRKVETTNSTDWLLTLKWRMNTKGVMDFHEIETSFMNADTDTFTHIQHAVHQASGHILDQAILLSSTIDEVRKILRSSGFTKDRILLDKYREEYSKDENNITLDFFPDGMGTYMEVESHTQHELNSIVADASITPNLIITTDYGDLLKEHKKHLPVSEQRVALFSAIERKKLLGS